ncbi:MAG TPA: hypothetical protein VF898_10175 [Chloroflexota bacterium]
MGSRIPDRVVEQLRDLVDNQDLVHRAIESIASYWREGDPEVAYWAFARDELQPQLGSQMLCLRSTPPNPQAPYIATHLELYVRGHRVGFYEFLTTLDGDAVQKSGGIMDDFYVAGRAAFLLERARERTPGDPEEWIGTVDVRANQDNTFLPASAAGGYATVLALARSKDEYRRHVEDFFGRMNLQAEELDDVEPLAERLAYQEVDDETLELAGALSESSPVACGAAIHTYGSDVGEEDTESL